MPYALHVFVIPPGGGKVSVEHVFYAESEAEAQNAFEQHADGCSFLTPAIQEYRVDEEMKRIPESDWPEYDD